MGRKVIIIEEEDGWYIFDTKNSDLLHEGIESKEESLLVAQKEGYEMPVTNKDGTFCVDMDGRPLYITKPSKSGKLELEYGDDTACLDFELCPVCKGPAFGRDSALKRRNCYYCPLCDKDIDCVPPAEWIGEMD